MHAAPHWGRAATPCRRASGPRSLRTTALALLVFFFSKNENLDNLTHEATGLSDKVSLLLLLSVVALMTNLCDLACPLGRVSRSVANAVDGVRSLKRRLLYLRSVKRPLVAALKDEETCSISHRKSVEKKKSFSFISYKNKT